MSIVISAQIMINGTIFEPEAAARVMMRETMAYGKKYTVNYGTLPLSVEIDGYAYAESDSRVEGADKKRKCTECGQ